MSGSQQLIIIIRSRYRDVIGGNLVILCMIHTMIHVILRDVIGCAINR